MKLVQRRRWLASFAGLLCVLALAACGPSPATVSGSAPVEPPRASAAPTAPGTSADKLGEPVHVTWLFDDTDPRELQRQLAVLQSVLNREGWNLNLDILPELHRYHLDRYATDAYITPTGWQADGLQLTYADPDKLLDSGATVDVKALCQQYAPVLAEKCGDLLTPAGVPVEFHRDPNQSTIYLLLLRDRAPHQWLAAPPTMGEIATWLEEEDVSLGQVAPDGSEPAPFPLALQAWAGEQGYYPLDILSIYGGFYAGSSAAVIQPVPMESIPGFDDMYRRLFALYKAGRYAEADTRAMDTVGYLSRRCDVQEGFLASRSITAGDMVAIPVRGTAWQKSGSREYDGPMLAITQNSQCAQKVLELAQWVLTTREGYDLASYGILNEDYTLPNGSLQWVKGSKMAGLYYRLVYDAAMDRVNRPANAADIAQLISYVKLPPLNLDKVGAYDETLYASPLQAVMEPVQQANAKLVGDRMALLMGKQPAAGEWGTKPVTSADAAFEMLDALKPQTAELAQAYAAELAKLQPK